MFRRVRVLTSAWCVLAMATPTLFAQNRKTAERERLAAALKSDPAARVRTATMGGKYAMLLRQLKVDEPGRHLVKDRGFKIRKTYRKHRDLPKGHWVYVRPYWFIWRDLTEDRQVKRSWGPEQATGKPNSRGGVDAQTAWATKLQNNPKPEWVLLEYANAVKATAVEIHETFNPGAISKVSLFKMNGEEVVAWRSKKIAPTGKPSRILKVPLPLGFFVGRIKIYFDTEKVKGWNEIDAVGLVDDKGEKHWATRADASTSYATDQPKIARVAPVMIPKVAAPVWIVPRELTTNRKLNQLTEENKKLRVRVTALEKALAEIQAALDRERRAKKK